MSHKLQTDIDGWGSVRNPLDEDEEFDVDEDGTITVDDEETAQALVSEYDRLRFVDDEDEGDEFDVGDFLDRTPMDDVVEDIRNGEADDHLDEIEDRADREGVQNAVENRRDEAGTE